MFTFKKKINNLNILNFLIALIPLSLIAGNLIININILLITIFGLLVYGKKIFSIENKIYQNLIYSFFFYLLLITFINNLPNIETNYLYKDNLFKSLYYLRYLIFFLVIYKLIEKKEFNIQIFFFSCAFFSLIISLDILFQFFMKKNIIGIPVTYYKPSSFFGQEHIAGGFLQRFSVFLIFLLPVIKEYKNSNLIIALFFLIIFVPILFTGNRMPTIIFAMIFCLYFFMNKKFKELLFTFVVTSLLIFTLIHFSVSQHRLGQNLNNFFKDSVTIIQKAPKLFFENKGYEIEMGHSGYLIHFNTGIQIWKKNKFYGNGLKSFRLNCEYKNYKTCNTHPHNYFIELLVDVGIIGTLIIYSIFFMGIINFIKYFYSENENRYKMVSYIFFSLIFFEFFPFRSTGSFFTTGNSVFIFLLLPFLLNINKLKKLQYKS